MPDSLRITLIVTTYNWPAALDLTLQSVARQSMAPVEIIVADDGSGPETERSGHTLAGAATYAARARVASR